MFQSYKYELRRLLRGREMLFWTLLFPIILGTLFHIVSENINATTIEEIPVAVVGGNDDSPVANAFHSVVEQLSTGEDAFLRPTTNLTMDEAREELANGEIEGIFHIQEDEVRLLITREGIVPSILAMVSDRFMQVNHTAETIATSHPQLIEEIMANFFEELAINQELQVGRMELLANPLAIIFLSFIAMALLNGAYYGYAQANELQADMSALAARRAMASMKKLPMVLANFFAAVTLQFFIISFVLVYYHLVIGIDFGTQIGFVLLTVFFGSLLSVSFGIFFGAVFKGGEEKTRDSILQTIIMGLTVLAGMISPQMRSIVRGVAPLFDVINPAAMIVDAFASLSMFANHAPFFQIIFRMLLATTVFCAGSVVLLRGNRYDSI